MNFSQRLGYTCDQYLQVGSIDEKLKIGIWNVIFEEIKKCLEQGIKGFHHSSWKPNNLIKSLWVEFFDKNSMYIPNNNYYASEVMDLFMNLLWYEIYDCIEFIVDKLDSQITIDNFNKILEKNNSAFRIINKIVTPITDADTMQLIEATTNSIPYTNVKMDLLDAQGYYSDKTNPNFRDSCKKSVDAIEALLYIKCNNRISMGGNINNLRKHNRINQHICNMLDKIYAHRNDVTGHGSKPSTNQHNPTLSEAILFHTISCAFINYLQIELQETIVV